MGQEILLNRSPFNFDKKIGKIVEIVIEFFTQKIGKVYFKLSFTVMDMVNNYSFNSFNQD